MKKVIAVIHGILEFRSGLTTNYEEQGLQYEYDFGRELAHKLTFRRYET